MHVLLVNDYQKIFSVADTDADKMFLMVSGIVFTCVVYCYCILVIYFSRVVDIINAKNETYFLS